MSQISRFKFIAIAKYLIFLIAWILLILIAAAIQAPPQAMATFLLIGIVGIPVGFVWLILVLVGILKDKRNQ
jgi:uncharacterized membrane protein